MKRRFVILEHDWPKLHWDLLIEDRDALRGWRLLESPFAGGEIPAEPTAPHRKAYLDYEGPVSDNRGSVRRVYRGEADSVDGGEAFHLINRDGKLVFEWKLPSLGG